MACRESTDLTKCWLIISALRKQYGGQKIGLHIFVIYMHNAYLIFSQNNSK